MMRKSAPFLDPYRSVLEGEKKKKKKNSPPDFLLSLCPFILAVDTSPRSTDLIFDLCSTFHKQRRSLSPKFSPKISISSPRKTQLNFRIVTNLRSMSTVSRQIDYS